VKYLLIDTSVWLDLARKINGQTLIVAVRVLVHQDRMRLLVPQVVMDEFERNQSRVKADMTRSMSAHFGRVRDAIEQHGQGEGREAALSELDNLTHRVPLINEMAGRNFTDVRELLSGGQRLVPSPSDHTRAVQRGIDKSAPFHRGRNSVADALLLEMYGSTVVAASDPSDEHAFVTLNTKDFSALGDDARLPHPDVASLFAGPRTRYFISLSAALGALFPDEFDELLDDLDFHDEPRTHADIRAAEQEMFDRIWYERSLSHEADDGVDVNDLRRVAGPGRARVEATYGPENLGRYSDFEWGMLNGKMSALRWVLSDEWDFLDM
jgi:hypothetical protein